MAAQHEVAVELVVVFFPWRNGGSAEPFVWNYIFDDLVEELRLGCEDTRILNEAGRQLKPHRVVAHVQLLAEGHVNLGIFLRGIQMVVVARFIL